MTCLLSIKHGPENNLSYFRVRPIISPKIDSFSWNFLAGSLKKVTGLPIFKKKTFFGMFFSVFGLKYGDKAFFNFLIR